MVSRSIGSTLRTARSSSFRIRSNVRTSLGISVLSRSTDAMLYHFDARLAAIELISMERQTPENFAIAEPNAEKGSTGAMWLDCVEATSPLAGPRHTPKESHGEVVQREMKVSVCGSISSESSRSFPCLSLNRVSVCVTVVAPTSGRFNQKNSPPRWLRGALQNRLPPRRQGRATHGPLGSTTAWKEFASFDPSSRGWESSGPSVEVRVRLLLRRPR